MPEIQVFRTPRLAEGVIRHPHFPPCPCPGAQKEREARAVGEQEAAERQKRERLAAACAAAGLAGALVECTFDRFERRADWPNVVDLAVDVRRFVDAGLAGATEDRPWLVMHGHYGTGKTHLAAAAIREAVSSGTRDCFFRPWTLYLERIKASWDGYGERGALHRGERTAEIVAELQRGRLVAIDDIDKARDPSGWAREILYTILDARYTARLPTILTFNYAPTEPDPEDPERVILERFMTLAAIDRLIGASWKMLDFDGPSYRSAVAWDVRPPMRTGRR